MVLHPEVQGKAQAELDIVVGPNRLPTFDDRQNLPYLGALILESMRWRPVGPLRAHILFAGIWELTKCSAISHANICDDVYDGYFIPKGGYILGLEPSLTCFQAQLFPPTSGTRACIIRRPPLY